MLGTKALSYIAPQTAHTLYNAYAAGAPAMHSIVPSGEQLNAETANTVGGYYEPKTELGRFTDVAGQFVPGGVEAGTSKLANALRVLGPSAGSYVASKVVTRDPWLHSHPDTDRCYFTWRWCWQWC